MSSREKQQVEKPEERSAPGSVLSPLLYNIYTNDQPISRLTNNFIFADDLAMSTQGSSFSEVEEKLAQALDELSDYYDANYLKPNPSKTQVCAFHLNNKHARKELNIVWRGERLQHYPNPRYLGVTLDRALTYKQHCMNTKAKVCARNNIIRKLTSRSWGANPHTLRTSAMALCLSTAEYAAPVWGGSAHAKQVDVALNETTRIITGCLRPTPTEKLYPLAGIAPPHIRRQVAADIERTKQETDSRHLLYSHQPPPQRLKSRESFMRRTQAMVGTPESNRTERWSNCLNHAGFQAKEELPPGNEQPYTVWRTLNRLRAGVARCKTNLKKWGLLPEGENDLCECGAVQNQDHLLTCANLDQPVTLNDLMLANDKAISAANFWKYIV